MSLAVIDSAILTALAAKVAVPATATAPFALAGRYAGPVTREGLSRVCGGQFPAVLLRFDGEQPQRIVNVLADVSDRGAATWSVIVALEDPRAIDDAMNQSAVGAAGILQLLDVALGAVNGLIVTPPGTTWRDRPLRASAAVPELVDEGVCYAYAARIEALRELPQAANPDPGAGLPLLNPVVGDVNLIGTGLADAVQPLVQFESEPNP